MLGLGILAKIVSLTKMIMPHATTQVRVYYNLADAFEGNVIVKQGDGQSDTKTGYAKVTCGYKLLFAKCTRSPMLVY